MNTVGLTKRRTHPRRPPLLPLCRRLAAAGRSGFLVAVLSGAAAVNADEGAAFERIKTLAGRWEGITYWSNDPENRQPVSMIYYLTGRESAVVENFDPGSGPEMTSVYHMDGAELRMTHYCAAGNQPRLEATKVDENGIHFSFVDATNLPSPDAGHVRAASLNFLGDDRLIVKFVFFSEGVELVETIEVERAGE